MPHPTTKTRFLIIGAGPFGLALAARVRELGIEHIVVGEPMGFWRANMPRGMYLRSACDWHLDAAGEHTIMAYLDSLGLKPADIEPLSLEFYLRYAQWFRERKGIEPLSFEVSRLDQGTAGYVATAADGRTITATSVAIAPGLEPFAHIPNEIASLVPIGRFGHTCHVVDLSRFAGKRVLLVGGRQSAFEWAALLREAGAERVDLSYRHDTPAFVASDWSWVSPLVDGMVENPGWFRNLSQTQRDDVVRALWAEGRLKVEPWLESRVRHGSVRLWPRTQLISCKESANGDLDITLDGGSQHVAADHVIFATGYKVDLSRVSYLAAGNLLAPLHLRDGFPPLGEHFQTDMAGLYMTSSAATRDFGPFFGFTVSARSSAHIIGSHVAAISRDTM